MGQSPSTTNDLGKIFAGIQDFAASRGHEFILPEHLLHMLLHNDRIARLVESVGADRNAILSDLEEFFTGKLERFNNIKQPLESLSFGRVLNAAFARAVSSEKGRMDVTDAFVAILEQDKTHAQYFLRKAGIDRYTAVKEISWGNYQPEDDPGAAAGAESHAGQETRQDPGAPAPAQTPGGGSPQTKFLRQFAVNLTDNARAGKIDPVIGRVTEIDRVMQTLCRKKKNNPLLTGEAGVGKTAVVEGLALKIAAGKVPDKIKDHDIWSLDLGSMIAGTKYRGEFEDRLKKVIGEVKQLDKAVIFIDELHTVMGAGASSSSSLDASNMLKPVLTSGKVRCIGACTYEDYKNHILKDKAFSRRFQKIDIHEPSESDAIAILKGLRPYYEKHFSVKFSAKAIELAVTLSKRHINDRFLPDKAVDIIDEAGAKNSLRGAKMKKLITASDIEEIVAHTANIPAAKIASSDMSALKNLESGLKSEIYGQDAAVSAVAKAIKISRAGIGNKDKPCGSFLFCGPTGCGKTELAKQLASQLGINFIRFDMSEYAEKHTVSKLIGAPPGYVGFEQSGMLSEALIRTPHSVVLLDEIEKAHPDIYNILLQIMDYGFLTDNNGRKADFRNAVVIMTSNVGAGESARAAIGFERDGAAESGERTAKAVEKYFSPEFRNRLDSTVYFNPLTLGLMKKITEKFIKRLGDSLKEKNIIVTADSAALEWLAKNGCDEKMGARPLERLIRTEIQERLVDEILWGRLASGGTVKATLKGGKIALKIKSKDEK
jgi:ATP-dependent Clp protease ATP-binding subunit ClpA